MRFIRALTTVVVACALTGTAVAASGSQAVIKVRATSLGKILVASNGRTLYLFARDKTTKSTCTGSCATFWPPLLTTGTAKAGAGVTAGLLGTTHRSDGTTQVTYHGHPLYFFAKDTKAGQMNGEGIAAFGAKWYVLSPAGVKILPASPGGGYGHG
jgi:predicted lipoprotein with Yx(FWY)xxD motif